MSKLVFAILALLSKSSLEISLHGVRAAGLGVAALIILAYWFR